MRLSAASLQKYSKKVTTWLISLTIFNSILATTSLFFFLSPLSKSICLRRLTDQDLWKATSAYSPILSRYPIPKLTTTTHTPLYDNPHYPSPLRNPIGTQADVAWDRIGSKVFPIIISSSDVLALGKDPKTAVKIPVEHGYGPDAYIAQTDVYHHLHCLDMLRKQASYTHYYLPLFGPFPGNDTQHIEHVGHCFAILAEALKCRGSADIITFNWVEGWNQPFPDFGNRHVCRDFEGMLEWNNVNAMPKEVFQAMKEPPVGYKRLPDPKDAWRFEEESGW